MSKSYSELFENTKGDNKLKPGIGYNLINSKSVKIVREVHETTDRKLPVEYHSNSVIRKFTDSDMLVTERYFNEKGKAYLDIDYTDHGNRKTHGVVPHEHDINFDKELGMIRSPWRKPK